MKEAWLEGIPKFFPQLPKGQAYLTTFLIKISVRIVDIKRGYPTYLWKAPVQYMKKPLTR